MALPVRVTQTQPPARPGTMVRPVQVGAVTIDGVSVPLDLPVERAVRLVVVPTFSGG